MDILRSDSKLRGTQGVGAEMVLPFISKEPIGDGSNAKTYKIKVHHTHNQLEYNGNPQQKVRFA